MGLKSRSALLGQIVVGLTVLGWASFIGAGNGVAASLPARASVAAVASRATLPGWISVAFGDIQLSVPPTWLAERLSGDGSESCGPTQFKLGVILLDWSQSSLWCPSSLGGGVLSPHTSVVSLRRVKAPHPVGVGFFKVNGIQVELLSRVSATASGQVATELSGSGLYWLPTLGIELDMSGPAEPLVLASLRHSPRWRATAKGVASGSPRTWVHLTFAGIAFAVPPTWLVHRLTFAPACGTDIVLAEPGVTLARKAPLPVPCPLPLADIRPVASVSGLEVDAWNHPQLDHCLGPLRRRSGLVVCLSAAPSYSVLDITVGRPGHRTIGLQLGLTGSGAVDRVILDSLRAG